MELKTAVERADSQRSAARDSASGAAQVPAVQMRAPYFIRIKRKLATVARCLLPGRQYDQLRHVYRRVRSGRVLMIESSSVTPAPSAAAASVPAASPPVPVAPVAHVHVPIAPQVVPPPVVTTVVHVDSQKERVDRLHERIEKLTDQIERLKSRNTTLDGKLNIALYGLPRMDRYADRLIANPLLSSVSLDFDADEFLLNFRGHDADVAARYHARLASLRELPQFRNFEPATLLDLGCGDGLVTQCLVEAWPSIDMVHGVDNASGGLQRLKDAELRGRSPLTEIQVIETGMLTALLALEGRKFDFISCVHAFEHLSPHEQIQFLVLASRALNPRGVLYLEAPNVLNLTVLRDLFWIDPQHLRPYSLTMLTAALDRFAAGKYEWGVWGESLPAARPGESTAGKTAAARLSGAEYYHRKDADVDTEYLDLFLCLKNS